MDLIAIEKEFMGPTRGRPNLQAAKEVQEDVLNAGANEGKLVMKSLY